VQQGLGRDTALAQAHAAGFIGRVYQGRLKAEIGGAESGDISAGACADDCDLCFFSEFTDYHIASFFLAAFFRSASVGFG
jgi:hypothetical protein